MSTRSRLLLAALVCLALAPAVRTAHAEDPVAAESMRLGTPSAGTSIDGSPGGLIQRLDPRTNELTRVGAALAVVLGLVFTLRAVLRRAGGPLAGGRPSGVLEVLARYPFGRGQQLIVIKWARRVVLVHRQGGQVTTLSEMSDPDEVAAFLSRVEAGTETGASFSAALHRHEIEHDRAAESTTAAPAPAGEREVVDLTRRRSRRRSALPWRRGAVA